MPRYEVTQVERQVSPLQIIFYMVGIIYFLIALLRIFGDTTTWTIINFMIAFSLFVYIIGRIMGDILVSKDFVELSADKVSFRSTPPFGEGWLPKTREIAINDIGEVQILEIEPIYAPSQKRLSLMLVLKVSFDSGHRLVQSMPRVKRDFH